MASSFKNEDGAKIVYDMIQAIQDNKQYLSDIDGLIGDGDHGINMNKGFTMCKEALDQEPGNMSASLKTLSNVLMEDIGGSMGPLYGCIFRAMFRASKGKEDIDKDVFKEMITKRKKESAISAVPRWGTRPCWILWLRLRLLTARRWTAATILPQR